MKTVAAWGWEHPAWTGGFYPDDLPDDWRLAYYANEFRAVIVPWERASRCTEEEVMAWKEDTHADFCFFLEAPPWASLGPFMALGERWGGTFWKGEGRTREGEALAVWPLVGDNLRAQLEGEGHVLLHGKDIPLLRQARLLAELMGF